jgi:hypothetical protein
MSSKTDTNGYKSIGLLFILNLNSKQNRADGLKVSSEGADFMSFVRSFYELCTAYMNQQDVAYLKAWWRNAVHKKTGRSRVRTPGALTYLVKAAQ